MNILPRTLAAAALAAPLLLASALSPAEEPLAAPTLLTVTSAPDEKAAPEAEGYWLGTLDFGPLKLRLGMDIKPGEDGAWTGTLDSVDQGASDIPLDIVSVKGREVVAAAAKLNLTIKGTLREDGSAIDAHFSQNGAELDTVFERRDGPATLQRPQNPVPPYPYKVEEVVFENAKAGIELAGTLTLPEGEGPFPAVALVTGSGPQDRDESLFAHKPFWVLADHLTRNGIAVLRYDDRGVGGSGGDFAKATTLDFVDDALAAVDCLRSREEVDPAKVGLIGHSEGAIVAPLAAAETKGVAFIVMMAGTGLTGAEILYRQAEFLMFAAEATDAEVALNRELQERLFDAIAHEPDDDKVRAKALAIYVDVEKRAANLSEGFQQQIKAGQKDFEALLTPWFRFFLTYDPLPTLGLVDVPALAINGSLDFQVPAKENLNLIRKALDDAGHQGHKVVELEGLNHLFQTAKTGHINEYGQIEETMSPKAMKLISDWILEVAGEASPAETGE